MSDSTSKLFFVIIALSVSLSSSCTVHEVGLSPEPIVSASESYTVTSPEKIRDEEVWWAAFQDPELDSLIRSGLENNFDVLQSAARLDQASALTLQARADRLPQVDVFAESEQRWREGNDRVNSNRLGADFSWEADVFNRLGSIVLARQSEQQARRDEVDAVRLRLSAEIAQAYFDAVGWRLQLALLSKQIETDKNLQNLTQLRFDSGLTARVDVLQQAQSAGGNREPGTGCGGSPESL